MPVFRWMCAQQGIALARTRPGSIAGEFNRNRNTLCQSDAICRSMGKVHGKVHASTCAVQLLHFMRAHHLASARLFPNWHAVTAEAEAPAPQPAAS